MATGTFAAGPAFFALWNYLEPAQVTKLGYRSVMRVTIAVSASAAFFRMYTRSSCEYAFSLGESLVDLAEEMETFDGKRGKLGQYQASNQHWDGHS